MRYAVFVALSLALLTGCTRTASTGAGGRHPWTVPHVLRIADLSDPDHLNPYLSEMDVTYDVSSLIYSYLVVADDRGRLIGDLASTVPSLTNGGISRDGRTYVYRLRRGVLWHDGAAFTSKDVVASWHAVIDPHNNTFEHEGYDRVASIDAPDAYTVVVHLRDRYPPFVSRFFAPLQEGGKPILPAHVLGSEGSFNTGTLSAHPVGTGPFEFVSWERSDRIVLKRFDRYFRGRPKLERIELRFIPTDQTIANELQAHRLDLIVAPQTSLLSTYKAVPGVFVSTAPWNTQAALIINASKPALHDLAVREAIADSVPYDDILRDVTFGLYEQARNVVAPTSIGYEVLPLRRQDLSAANHVLDARGWRRGSDGIRARDGVRLEITVATIAGFTNAQRALLLLQAALHETGVALAIKNYPYRTIFAPDGPVYGGTYDTAFYSNTINWDPDISNFVGCDRWYPKGQNIYRFCDPRLDALELAGLRSDDPAVRAPVYRRANLLMWNDVPYIPVYEGRRLIVRSDDLRNYRPNTTATPWWNAWEWDI
ncbi:MAG TPA: peptide ABC transporter substrate-binding protein [Candidatus Baltobacteraceae bacterium]|jgi:peptide/nickel transport system substrate-binding protein